jgi:hypothetical protein
VPYGNVQLHSQEYFIPFIKLLLAGFSMNNQDYIPYKEAIIECAKQFRQDANALMAQLAAEYNFEIAAPLSLPKEVYRHYNNK